MIISESSPREFFFVNKKTFWKPPPKFRTPFSASNIITHICNIYKVHIKYWHPCARTTVYKRLWKYEPTGPFSCPTQKKKVCAFAKGLWPLAPNLVASNRYQSLALVLLEFVPLAAKVSARRSWPEETPSVFLGQLPILNTVNHKVPEGKLVVQKHLFKTLFLVEGGRVPLHWEKTGWGKDMTWIKDQ